MNRRILSVFVFRLPHTFRTGARRERRYHDAMLNQIKQSYEGTSADKALRNAIGNNDIRKLALNQENLAGMDTHFSVKVNSKGHHRPEIIRSLLAFHRAERDACQSHR